MQKDIVVSQRKQLLRRVENFFETPMIILGFIWLALLVVEFVAGLTPFLELAGLIIWGIFIVDFLIKFLIAPEKLLFLRKNVITIISLAVPAFRVFRLVRILRFLRFSRSLRLVKVIGSLNRGMRALGATMSRRAFGYVFVLTLLVLFVGAAGMFAFEKNEGLTNYGASVWWTAMLLMTMGSEYWPRTPEGRILCVILAMYAFAMFGYFTATIATFFIGRDAEDDKAEIAGTRQIEDLRKEIRELKELLQNQNRTSPLG
jgi:voltage-gated potassium channel